MREYHTLRVNLTPAQVDQLESNHKDLRKHLSIMRDELSETSLALNTMVNEEDELPDPLDEGTATKYIDGCLKAIKNDPSMRNVRHPWTKVETQHTRRIQALRRNRPKTVTLEEKLNQIERIGKKGRVTDLKGVHRSIRKTSSILSSAIAEAPKTKQWYTPQLRRPSTVPPPRRPMQALKKLQYAIVEDLDAYKRLSPRERGPGMYNVNLEGALTIKEPNKPSYCFSANAGRGPVELQSTQYDNIRPRFTTVKVPKHNSSTAGGGDDGGNNNNNNNNRKKKLNKSSSMGEIDPLGFQNSFAALMFERYGAPKTYSERQKKVKKILELHSPVKSSSMRLPLKKISRMERLHQGKHAYTRRRRKKKLRGMSRTGGSRHGVQSMPDLNDYGSLVQSPAGKNLWQRGHVAHQFNRNRPSTVAMGFDMSGGGSSMSMSRTFLTSQ